MKANYEIVNFAKEQQQVKKQTEQQKKYRYQKLKEFRESECDLFDMQDFYYYADEIGCNVRYLLNCARYSSDNKNRIARNLQYRREFYLQNGHSITKPNPIFNQ